MRRPLLRAQNRYWSQQNPLCNTEATPVASPMSIQPLPIQRPQRQRFGDVRKVKLQPATHISDRARHLQDAVVTASRQAELLHGPFQDTQASSVRRAITLHCRIIQECVADSLPPYLYIPRPHDSRGNLCAAFAPATLLAQVLELYP